MLYSLILINNRDTERNKRSFFRISYKKLLSFSICVRDFPDDETFVVGFFGLFPLITTEHISVGLNAF